MKVLVLGGGGREHALVLALARDPAVEQVYAAPGNPGIAEVASLRAVDVLDGAAVAALAREVAPDVATPSAPAMLESRPELPDAEVMARLVDSSAAAAERHTRARSHRDRR